jgi:SAM-dependent methyltransferase
LGAAGYHWLFDHVDPLGGADHRRRLVEQAAGEVLEIGAGTGRNLPLYRTATRVVALEPAPGMRASANQAGLAARVAVEVVDGTAEDLPLPRRRLRHGGRQPGAVHGPDPAGALAEARRVLRPGGTLRFDQHVRATDPRLARWQDRLGRPWGWLAAGCHPNRDVMAAIAAAGFHVLELDRFDFQIMPPLVRPPRPGSGAATHPSRRSAGGRGGESGMNVQVTGATRVHGRDVEPVSTSTRMASLACRLYRLEHRLTGRPAERWVRDALLAAGGTTPRQNRSVPPPTSVRGETMGDKQKAARVAWATIKLSHVGQCPVSLDQLANHVGLPVSETARSLRLTWQERIDLRDGIIRLDATPACSRRYRVHAGGRPVGPG